MLLYVESVLVFGWGSAARRYRREHTPPKYTLTEITFSSRRKIEVCLDLDWWSKSYQHAMQNHTVIDICDISGHRFCINPRQVAFTISEPMSGNTSSAARAVATV
jgi:hypothetical protein